MLLEQGVGPQPPREITSPLEIQSLLKALQASRTPLEIRFDDRSQTFQSYIVELAANSNTLFIDELIPSLGDKWMEKGESFRIEAWMDGVHIRWDNRGAIKVHLADDAPAFSLNLPSQLTYHQRRGAYRAAVHRSIDTCMELIHPERKRRFSGELLNISATGCKLRLAGNVTQALAPGERYETSRLQLEADQQLVVNVEVRHREYLEASDETHVGLHFHQPTAQVQRHIDRFVNQLQREARRLAKEDLF
ncbi:MAG: flagellar regulator YcgR PilZN domain-containing protein [Pseudomonas sp.]